MNYLDSRELFGNSTDKIINNGECGKERPDRIYEFEDKIIILECDENQHKERACECEQSRMINIGQSFGGIPIYFIRWNPDKYKPKYKEHKQESINNRHKLCGDLISDIKQKKYIFPNNNAFISVIYLYYDNWDNINAENWQVLSKLEI
jgi:hypothetical protein